MKALGYAYPSSIIASKTGYGKTGCWYVMHNNKYIGFNKFQSACEFFNALDDDHDRWSALHPLN